MITKELGVKNAIFINRTINFKKIKYFGFDQDHTLVRYNTYNFEKLTHDIVVQKLVEKKGYPKNTLDLPFEFDSVIRGLVVDKKRGNLLKLNSYGYIRQSQHGTKVIDYKEQKKIYKGAHLDLSDSNYSSLDTAFSVAFASLYSRLVDCKDETPKDFPSYADISEDTLWAVDEAHRDGTIKEEVKNNLEKYILRDPRVGENLEKFLKHGKKLFIVTNSDYNYSKALLDYALNPYFKEYKDWSEVFEYVITLARKPRFFYDKQAFLKVNPENGTLTNYESDLTPGIYQGGNANNFTDQLGLSGDEILYVGDHIYGDIVRLKKDCNWRTALVLEELNFEVDKLKEAKPYSDKIHELMDKKEPLELKLAELQDNKKEGTSNVDDATIDNLFHEIQNIDKEISGQIQSYDKIFNPYWGEVMRTGNEESYFAGQVQRYACIYTSKLINILNCSPRTYFRAFRSRLPHETY